MAELFNSLPVAPVLHPVVQYLVAFCSRPEAADVISGGLCSWPSANRRHSVFCQKHDKTWLRRYSILLPTALKTRSSPQWWSGRSTTSHDVLNMWSPICDPSGLDTCGSGMGPVDSPPFPGFPLAPYWRVWSISYRFWVINLAPKAFPFARPTWIRWQLPL